MIDDNNINVNIIPHKLDFKFAAGTSRATLHHRWTYFVVLTSTDTRQVGWGEAAPLDGLSVEDETFHLKMKQSTASEPLSAMKAFLKSYPSTRFALESALLDLENGGQRLWFDGPVVHGQKRIPINGLIWMGSRSEMFQRIKEKLDTGYQCLKLKIGGIDFEEEVRLLQYIRSQFSETDLELRLDANGSFPAAEAKDRLNTLAAFDIHSIEQPIMAGQWEIMRQLCEANIIPIALDEELIGLKSPEEQSTLIEAIQPQYLIFKPSLIGGIQATKNYIDLCNHHHIGWWMTSALESNVGLNILAQLSDKWAVERPQGLGTGKLFHNNIDSPLREDAGWVYCEPSVTWGSLPPKL